jgi:hypothetical protein
MSGKGIGYAGLSGIHAARLGTIAVPGSGWNYGALLALNAGVDREASGNVPSQP